MVRREKLGESRGPELLRTAYNCVIYSGFYGGGNRNDDSINDRAQEIAMGAWTHRESYDPSKGALSTWVRRITERHLIDRGRRRRVESEKEKRYSNEHGSRRMRGVEENKPDPAFRENELYGLISELPECLREVAMLRARGMSYGSIAKATEEPLGTIKSRMFRIKDILRPRIKQED